MSDDPIDTMAKRIEPMLYYVYKCTDEQIRIHQSETGEEGEHEGTTRMRPGVIATDLTYDQARKLAHLKGAQFTRQFESQSNAL